MAFFSKQNTSQSPLEKRAKALPSFKTRSRHAAINNSRETPKEQQPANNNFVHFIDNIEENSETLVYNIDPDSQTTSPIKIVGSSSANIFSNNTARPPQAPQHNIAEDEQHSVCPISINPAPSKKAPNTNESEEQVTKEQSNALSSPH